MILLTPKELGFSLRRNAAYVYAMTRDGFPMPGGTATLDEARAHLAHCPCPRRRRSAARSAAILSAARLSSPNARRSLGCKPR
jgi:hypothetical protein